MKKNNPETPILIREAQGTIPKIYARYGQSGNQPTPAEYKRESIANVK